MHLIIKKIILLVTIIFGVQIHAASIEDDQVYSVLGGSSNSMVLQLILAVMATINSVKDIGIHQVIGDGQITGMHQLVVQVMLP